MPQIPVSWGELVDKLTILELKSWKFDGDKQAMVITELMPLRAQYKEVEQDIPHLYADLKNINSLLWDLENDIRAALKEKKLEIVATQLEQIHELNWDRHTVKEEIDFILESSVTEQKDYTVK